MLSVFNNLFSRTPTIWEWVATVIGLSAVFVIGFLISRRFTGKNSRASRERLAQSQRELQVEVRTRLQTQKALRDAEDKYRSIFQFTIEGIATTSVDGKFFSVNPALARILGYESPEDLMDSVNDIASQLYVDPDDRKRFLEMIEARGAGRFKFEARRKDGKHIWLSMSARGIHDEAGQLEQVEAIVEDVTEEHLQQQLLGQSESRLRLAIEASHMGIWDWDLATNNVVCSPTCEKLMGLEDHGAKRNHIELLRKIFPADLSMLQAVLDRAVLEKGEYEAEYRVRWPDQSVHWISGRGKVFCDEKSVPVRVVGTVVDITEEKRAEEHRREVETALQRHADELARSNRELEQFAYVSSHDLKEPLRMVNVFVDLLMRQLDGRLDEETKENFRFVCEGARRMQSLVNDLMTYSRVGKELSPYQSVDLNDVGKMVRMNLQDAIKESGADIHFGDLPAVMGYSSQLVQLLQNLIGNAIKFRGDESLHVDVTAERCGTEWRIAVSDNGIGIGDRYLNKIFVVFQRLHNSGRYPGTGIGLSICKKIVENHSGRIWVTSELGRGSTFYFTLPPAETMGLAMSH